MSDPGPRQRPEYGEYATPEEQRARIRQPDATWALDTGQTPDEAAAAPTPAPGAPSPATPADASRAVARPTDRIITIALLVWGAINVTMSIISFLDLPSVAAQAMQIMGVEGEFTNIASARLWGGIAAGALALGYLLTVLFSVRRVRRGRVAWWIPIVGAVATYFVVYICISVPLLSDPAFLSTIQGG